MILKEIALALLLFSLFSGNLVADDLEDALSGFDQESTTMPTGDTADELVDLDESGFDSPPIHRAASSMPQLKTKMAGYELHGYSSLLGVYNYAQNNQSTVAAGDKPMSFSGLSRARAKAGLTLEIKNGENWQSKLDVIAWYDPSWSINGRAGYTNDVLDTYESFIDIKDAYIHGSLTKNIDLKFGRQVVIWGKSDSIRITDVINPLDNREPGMVDIEDLRLSEVMTRLDYYFGDWSLSGIIIHEPRLEIEAAFGSDYRPSDMFGTSIPYANFPDRKELSWSLDNTQYAMSLDGRFSGWDISYYAAHVYDNRFDIQVINTRPTRFYNKIYTLGIASNIVFGSWLLKAESALINDISYRSTGMKNRLDALIGFDYMGFKDTVISLELAARHIFDYEDKMLTMTLAEAITQNTFPDFVREDSVQMALRTTYRFDHDNATVNYLLSLAGGNGPGEHFDGGFQRLWLNYKYTDAIALKAGVVDYFAGDSLISLYRATEDNDRLFTEIRYNF